MTEGPKLLPSILNCTDPVGVAPPASGETVAVNDTDWPKLDGLSDDAISVVVLAGSTVWDSFGLWSSAKSAVAAVKTAFRFLLPVDVGVNVHCPADNGA